MGIRSKKRTKVQLVTRVEPEVLEGLTRLAQENGTKLYSYTQRILTNFYRRKANA